MRLNSFSLKCIAIVSMFLDHLGAIIFPQYKILRILGRIAFPIFCFLLVEGVFHTRDVRKYMIRLGIFALLSEFPFDLALHHSIWDIKHQNVFFTLFFGVTMMYVLEKYQSLYIKGSYVLVVMWLAVFLHTDYSIQGIFLILTYYTFYSNRELSIMAGVLWNIVMYMDIEALNAIPVQYFGSFAAIPLSMYNGKRGPRMKYFFYLFYPGHLILLYFCKRLFM